MLARPHSIVLFLMRFAVLPFLPPLVAPYLDIVRDVRTLTQAPIAIYHVSGEYAMLWHAAAAGAFGLAEAVNESLMGAKRAGATILITYYTPFLLKNIREQQAKTQANELAQSQAKPE
jgi:hypothetical protein